MTTTVTVTDDGVIVSERADGSVMSIPLDPANLDYRAALDTLGTTHDNLVALVDEQRAARAAEQAAAEADRARRVATVETQLSKLGIDPEALRLFLA